MSDTSASITNRKHAIVIGGSMAGLMTARMLTQHFDRVTVLERDQYPSAPAPRRGVPQSYHLHVLLLAGLAILDRLFPGLREDLIAEGAVEIDSGSDLKWLTPAGWGVRFSSGLIKLAFTRDLLDWVVRRRLEQSDRIEIASGYEAIDLVSDRAGNVTGLQIKPSDAKDRRTSKPEELRASLVVDASGRGSRTPGWLSRLGFARPPETTVNAFLGYASRLYRRPANIQADWKAIFIQAAPPKRNRAGVLFPLEGDRWGITVAGGARDYPPTDHEGFMEFVRSLPGSLIYENIKRAEPLSPIYGYRATANRQRHYEKVRMPERFLVLGDAVCAFNPVYGQGITTAALATIELDRCLSEWLVRRPDGDLTGLSTRFQKRLAKINSVPWTLATTEDLRFPMTIGAGRPLSARLMSHYVDAVIASTTANAEVRQLWLEVFHMLKSPSALLRPRVMLKVLKHTFSIQDRITVNRAGQELLT